MRCADISINAPIFIECVAMALFGYWLTTRERLTHGVAISITLDPMVASVVGAFDPRRLSLGNCQCVPGVALRGPRRSRSVDPSSISLVARASSFKTISLAKSEPVLSSPDCRKTKARLAERFSGGGEAGENSYLDSS